jgi:hypothetical protein
MSIFPSLASLLPCAAWSTAAIDPTLIVMPGLQGWPPGRAHDCPVKRRRDRAESQRRGDIRQAQRDH